MAKDGNYQGFNIENLQTILKEAEALVLEKLATIKEKGQEKVDIGDIFDLQWMMNKFSQLTETSSAILAAAHSAITSINRNLK